MAPMQIGISFYIDLLVSISIQEEMWIKAVPRVERETMRTLHLL